MERPSATSVLDPAPMMADGLPVQVYHDRTLRVKVIDACGMTCTFCHNEGTPVLADNLGVEPDAMTARGRSGRVSIYLSSKWRWFLAGHHRT